MFLVFAPIAVKIAPANADCPLGINVFLPSLFFLVVAYAIIPIITIAVNVIPVKAKSPGDFIILKVMKQYQKNKTKKLMFLMELKDLLL